MNFKTSQIRAVLLLLYWSAYVCSKALADADGPDFWAVTNVSGGSHLNLRKGASVQFPVLNKIPFNFQHLENLGCSPPYTEKEWFSFSKTERKLAAKLRWCRVQYRDQIGWVSGVYLKEGFSPKHQ